jgi:type 1 glutamine amidotransferase
MKKQIRAILYIMNTVELGQKQTDSTKAMEDSEYYQSVYPYHIVDSASNVLVVHAFADAETLVEWSKDCHGRKIVDGDLLCWSAL